ncbi:hypothetical protein AMTRI_Chr02g262000 [Amborella trichopoda]
MQQWLLQGDEDEKVLSGEEGGFGEEAVMEVIGSSSSCDTYTYGNHETFGPSFSNSKTTVMASIDMAGLVFQMLSSSETENSSSQIPAATKTSCSFSI